MNYPHIAARVFNAPLLVAPAKLDAIIAGLTPYFLGQPKAGSTDPMKKRRAYEVTPSGVAIVPVMGTLVRRGGWMAAESGLRAYETIQGDVLDAATDPAVKGILLQIDSPGGEVSGLFDLVDTLYEARELKPIFAAADDDAFSAAYGIASAAEQIFVTRTGGVGSVGVVAVHLDRSQADAKAGLTYTIFRAGEYKAEHNPIEPLTDHARATFQAEVDRLHGIFTDTVARNRGIPTAQVRNTEAGLFYGADGVKAGFADRVGTLRDALTALEDRIAKGSAWAGYSPRADRNAAESPLAAPGTTLRGAAAHHTDQKGKVMEKDDKAAPAAAEQPQAAPQAGEGAKIIDLDAARAEGRGEGYEAGLAYAKEVRELCALAGKPAAADDFIARRVPTAAVREALINARAAAGDAQEVVSRVEGTPGAERRGPVPASIADVYARRRARIQSLQRR